MHMLLPSLQFMKTNTNMNYTDTQLKAALAKMLPEQFKFHTPENELWWVSEKLTAPVLDTELLHVCWLITKTLSVEDRYRCVIYHYDNDSTIEHVDFDATWQQRTIALAKMKGVEIL